MIHTQGAPRKVGWQKTAPRSLDDPNLYALYHRSSNLYAARMLDAPHHVPQPKAGVQRFHRRVMG